MTTLVIIVSDVESNSGDNVDEDQHSDNDDDYRYIAKK